MPAHSIHELDDALLVSCASVEERNELLAAAPDKFFITPLTVSSGSV